MYVGWRKLCGPIWSKISELFSTSSATMKQGNEEEKRTKK